MADLKLNRCYNCKREVNIHDASTGSGPSHYERWIIICNCGIAFDPNRHPESRLSKVGTIKHWNKFPESDNWISVKKKLPELPRGGNGFVYCLAARPGIMTVQSRFNTVTKHFQDMDFNNLEGVTDWQHLPVPPKN